MNERYLFRGKRNDSGEWINGLLWEDNGEMSIGYYDGMWHDGPQRVLHQVDPATIGQCTGLRDKNGELIFEGDVVQWHSTDPELSNDEASVVKWYQCGWHVDTGCDTVVMGCETLDGDRMVEWEIIGNIQDTPELLSN